MKVNSTKKLRTAWGIEIWGVLLTLAALAVLPLYPVRQMLAAELLFAVLFVSMVAFGAILYLLGAVGERGADVTKAKIEIVAQFARRCFGDLEGITRRLLHQHGAVQVTK